MNAADDIVACCPRTFRRFPLGARSGLEEVRFSSPPACRFDSGERRGLGWVTLPSPRKEPCYTRWNVWCTTLVTVTIPHARPSASSALSREQTDENSILVLANSTDCSEVRADSKITWRMPSSASSLSEVHCGLSVGTACSKD